MLALKYTHRKVKVLKSNMDIVLQILYSNKSDLDFGLRDICEQTSSTCYMSSSILKFLKTMNRIYRKTTEKSCCSIQSENVDKLIIEYGDNHKVYIYKIYMHVY